MKFLDCVEVIVEKECYAKYEGLEKVRKNRFGIKLNNLKNAKKIKKLAESEYNWFNVPDETRENFSQVAMEEAILAYPNLSIYATAENAHMAQRMNHIFKQTIWALTTRTLLQAL